MFVNIRCRIHSLYRNNHFKEKNRIDGMPFAIQWNIFPGIRTLSLLEKIQSLMRDLQCELEHFKNSIIFMSMCNDIAWENREMQKDTNTIHRQLRNMLVNCLAVIGLSWRLEQQRSCTELASLNPTEPGTEWRDLGDVPSKMKTGPNLFSVCRSL